LQLSSVQFGRSEPSLIIYLVVHVAYDFDQLKHVCISQGSVVTAVIFFWGGGQISVTDVKILRDSAYQKLSNRLGLVLQNIKRQYLFEARCKKDPHDFYAD